MTNEFNFSYQYDRCVSRGICSINPTTSSLLEIVLIYLRITAFCCIKLKENGIFEKHIKNLILNTISILNSGYEISEDNFNIINSAFKKELPLIINKYEELFGEKASLPNNFDIWNLLNSKEDLNYYIRLGERELNNRTKNIPSEIRNLYKIIFLIIKSFCINILVYESYGNELEEEFRSVLDIFNLLNKNIKSKKKLKKIIVNLAEKDCCLMLKIRTIQEKEYGIQNEQEISFSTQKGKGILVVGTNLKELELILDKFKNTNIDIYTHDNMILAHTFPKFKEYKNLKGQFGQGMENCLLDFSTFPGPIIITRNSLYNVENLYRGLLYTTDFAYSKGVIPIKNNDFTDVIKAAENSRGFKNGKECNSEKFGFNYNNLIDNIYKKISEGKYSQVLIIGTEGYSTDEKEYFKNLIQHAPNDILIISFSCCSNINNLICLNSSTDNYNFLKLANEIINHTKLNISVFVPFCDRHLLSVSIFINSLRKINLFIGKWNQTTITPNIMDSLKNEFNIMKLSTPKKDLERIKILQ